MPSAGTRSREPLYLRIYNEIATQIAAGTLSPDGRLPPERVISEQMGVSRATVRRALAALEAEGAIQATQGRGTFLTTPRLVEPPNALMSFTELARHRGTTAGAIVVGAGVRPATLDEANDFRIAPGSEIFALTRLRTIDSISVAIDHSVVPAALAPELPNQDWTSASLYQVLRVSGYRPARADYLVEARAATPEQSELLQAAPGATILFAKTRAYARTGQLIQVGEIAYRGDRYRFQATLIAQPELGAGPVPISGE
jgi:DNA-binding GntR family transcriptional regulator